MREKFCQNTGFSDLSEFPSLVIVVCFLRYIKPQTSKHFRSLRRFLPTTANCLWVSLYSLYPKQGEVPRCIAHLIGSGRLDSNQRSSPYEGDEIDHFSTPVDVALRSASHTSFPYLYPAFRAFVRLVAVVVGGAALPHLRYLYRCIGNHFQP